MGIKNKFSVKRDDDMDAMLPFMSLLLIIIPVLIGNVAFNNLRSIELSTPGVSEPNPNQPPPEEDLKKDKMITAKLLIEPNAMLLEMIDEETANVEAKLQKPVDTASAKEMFQMIRKYKEQYPKLDVVMVNINKDVTYDKIVSVLDEIKKPIKVNELASLDEKDKAIIKDGNYYFNLVMLPKTIDLEIKGEE
jgi:biopolymer transport protein ExbD